MKFEVLPVVGRMLALYALPRGRERFQRYLGLLQGSRPGDLELPLQFYNPMAREPVADRLLALRLMKAEALMQEAIHAHAHRWKEMPGGTFRMALNLADDLHGGWTNRYTTDYDSRFRLGALLKRQLAVALFWVSEQQHPALIRETTVAACLRTVHWLKHGPAQTLAQHLEQEGFALSAGPKPAGSVSRETTAFYEAHKESRDPQLIFNFLYGDAAAESMGNSPLGIGEDFAGLRLAAQGTGS